MRSSEGLDVAGAALERAAKTSDPKIAIELERAATALKKAERRIDALEIVVRELAKGKLRMEELEAQATRQFWPRDALRDLLK